MDGSNIGAPPPLEDVSRIEPCRLPQYGPEVADVLVQLPAEASALGAQLHPQTAASLAGLVRVMNCYYSNLIEGHNTRPRDIERALADQLDTDRQRRDLQLEAKAHIRVQQSIDAQHAAGTLPEPASPEFVRWLHLEFYRDAPAELLKVGEGERAYQMVAGEFRARPEQDNVVGRHQPPSSSRVCEFMDYFASRYRFSAMGPAERLVSIAAAHHRLNYIHPFPDGNGRVSRLMSHAMAHLAGIGAHGLWSVSRGLARGLESRTEYKAMMDLADAPREGDLDGRGNLSLRRLEEFVAWFLKTCLDQLRFMRGMFELDSLRERLRVLVQRQGWKSEALLLLEEALVRGELNRGAAARVTGLPERSARDVLAQLVADGVLSSSTAKGPVSLRFSVTHSDVLFPKLFLES